MPEKDKRQQTDDFDDFNLKRELLMTETKDSGKCLNYDWLELRKAIQYLVVLGQKS